jgi:virginiamycin A acetyltransferase
MLKKMPESRTVSSPESTQGAHLLPLPSPSSSKLRTFILIKSVLKGLGIVVGIVLTAVPAFTSNVERFFTGRDPFFLFWGELFALLPGLPGHYIRKCFYFLTLHRCSLNCEIGFLTYIHDRRAQIGERVYIGTGVGIGWVSVGDGCLLASRVSVLSGRGQHELGPDGRLTPFDRSAAKHIHIGENTWIGEGAIIMADVGSRCIVGAGSIVTKPVTCGFLVAGNPARSIRCLVDGQSPLSEVEDVLPSD